VATRELLKHIEPDAWEAKFVMVHYAKSVHDELPAADFFGE